MINWIALGVFIFFFLLVTVLGFVAARWRRGDLTSSPSGGWLDVASVQSLPGSCWVVIFTPLIPLSLCLQRCTG
jgi:hypothetical protein